MSTEAYILQRRAIERLFSGDAEASIHRIVRWRLGRSAPFQDHDDVVSEVILDLLIRLNAVLRGDSEPILDFGAYAAVAAHHGCDKYLRRQIPSRHRLDSRVRYILEESTEYASWREVDASDIAGPEPDWQIALIWRAKLHFIWAEIKELPQPQRFALLMNLRNEDGESALTSLPATGIASICDIAAALPLPTSELIRMWHSLPLNDLKVAEMLGLTRQQVINLRKSARKRLARRWAGNMDPRSSAKKQTALSF